MASSNDKIYELINSLRLELKADIRDQGESLSKQIDNVDKKLDSRLEPIETDVSNLKIDSATGNVKVGIISAIGATIASSIIGIIVLRWFK